MSWGSGSPRTCGRSPRRSTRSPTTTTRCTSTPRPPRGARWTSPSGWRSSPSCLGWSARLRLSRDAAIAATRRSHHKLLIMARIDLTHFGFTPTESLVYEVLLTGGPGTGYAIARSAGLARANAYSALEGLVSKGAARVDAGRPRRYRPEPPAALHRPDLERPWASAGAAEHASWKRLRCPPRRPWSRSSPAGRSCS